MNIQHKRCRAKIKIGDIVEIGICRDGSIRYNRDDAALVRQYKICGYIDGIPSVKSYFTPDRMFILNSGIVIDKIIKNK